jgi:hypothetical protein
MSSFINLLTNIDIFANGMNLKINKANTAKTPIGGLLTIILLMLMGLLFIVNLISLFSHLVPQVTTETTFLDSVDLTINYTNMPIALGLFDPITYKPLNVTGILELSAQILEYDNLKVSVKTTSLEINFCELFDFPVIDKQTFLETRLGKFYCIKNQNLQGLQGDFSRNLSVIFIFRISFCKNTTENQNSCLGLDAVNKFFSNYNVLSSLIIGNPIYNVQKYTSFMNFSIFNVIRSVNPSVYKNVQIHLSTLELKSNNGYIWDSFSQNSSIVVNNVQYDDNILYEGILLDFIFYAKNTKETFHRSYPKLQNIIANIGGLLKVFMIAFKIIGGFFSSLLINESILNKVYCFDFSDETGYKINQSQNDQIKNSRKIYKETNSLSLISGRRVKESSENISYSRSRILTIPFKSPGIDIYKAAAENYIEKIKNSKIHFTFKEIIQYFFPCCYTSQFRKKVNLYKLGYEKFDELLDASHIIEKLQEIDKIKFITLKDEQLILFNLLSKYFISPGSTRNFLNKMDNLGNLHNNPDNIKNIFCAYFKKMKSKSDFSSIIDVKLNELVCEQLNLDI